MSLRETDAMRNNLIKQLLFFDEDFMELFDKTLNAINESNALSSLVDRYRERVGQILNRSAALDSEVLIGGTVTINFEEDGMEETFTIVLPNYSNVDEGYISFMSPMGRKLLLSRVGDRVEIDSPAENYTVIIKDVSYIHPM